MHAYLQLHESIESYLALTRTIRGTYLAEYTPSTISILQHCGTHLFSFMSATLLSLRWTGSPFVLNSLGSVGESKAYVKNKISRSGEHGKELR